MHNLRVILVSIVQRDFVLYLPSPRPSRRSCFRVRNRRTRRRNITRSPTVSVRRSPPVGKPRSPHPSKASSLAYPSSYPRSPPPDRCCSISLRHFRNCPRAVSLLLICDLKEKKKKNTRYFEFSLFGELFHHLFFFSFSLRLSPSPLTLIVLEVLYSFRDSGPLFGYLGPSSGAVGVAVRWWRSP